VGIDDRLIGGSTAVHRRGEVVVREARPWSGTVLALLRHLEAEGFDAAPRVVGEGFDADGNEMLTYVHGERADRADLTEEGCFRLGEVLSALHGATASFAPGFEPSWMPWWGRDLGDDRRVIGHCDAVPWNVLVGDGLPIALIDWDTAGPVGPRWELAQTAWLHARLYGPESITSGALPDLPDRFRRLRLLVDGYGLARPVRLAFLDTMIEFAVRSAAQETVDSGVGPTSLAPATMAQVGGGTPLAGHDLLWAMTWRTRSVVWMLEHRRLLEAALE
jgi:hypothetical protein